MNLLKTFISAVTATAVLALSSVVVSAQSTWDAIQERGTLRIGVTQAPPWFTKDISSGEWTGGLGVTLGQKMAEALPKTLHEVLPPSDLSSKQDELRQLRVASGYVVQKRQPSA